MKQAKTKATIGALATLISYVSLNSWAHAYHPEAFIWSPQDRENAEWVATSNSWLDRKACRWLGVCGGSHIHFSRQPNQALVSHEPALKHPGSEGSDDWQNAWKEPTNTSKHWNKDEKTLREIPEYVLEYAPLVHLFSGERYWPCDIAEHLYHVTPELNYTAIQSGSVHPALTDLNKYNEYHGGGWVYLTSNDNPEEYPDWLGGQKNIPSVPEELKDDFSGNDGWVHRPGRTYLQGIKDVIADMKEWFGSDSDSAADLKESATAAKEYARLLLEQGYHQELKRKTADEDPEGRFRGGRSEAPAVLIAIDKGHGVVDAFWFFFYSFNRGNSVFNVVFGNHVGDWEHTAIRFHHGEPKAVFFSEHNFGSAYSYDAVEKIGKRPVIYSATGSHAMYATPGLHPYVLPWGVLHDQTDRGPLWDPTLNSHAFTYDFEKDILRASNITPRAPTGWFHYAGRWGDKLYPLGDKRQYRFAGQYHYVSGPLGPKFKNLGRKKICGGPDRQPCIIKHWLGGESKIGRLQHKGEESDLYTEEERHLGISQ
ncbi:Vacuolar protein sorting-associated protein 62 [Lithohypha guttulata]|uniref:Vacuolar protein sorting-associated protein 62 n=1 Tax=Lithohypha guttulata TaxID=1690604 RepID=UPI002DDE6815|nr:Vacuolar protein sorting-associated protein 62 [Lithohypha guttulata]